MATTLINNIIEIIDDSAVGYKYVHAVQKVTTTQVSLLESNIVDSTSSVTLGTDGYYIVSSLSIPDSDTGGYYTDGTNIYAPGGTQITISELLEIDTTGTEVERTDYDIVSYYYINKYYVDLLTEKFSKDICGCGCENDPKKLIIDTLTMGIKVLDTLVYYKQYYEAERIIEQLGTCSGTTNTNCSCYA